MEFDSRKKSEQDSMMHSKSFETQGVRDRPEGSRRVEWFSHFMDGSNGRCLPNERKGMQSPGKIKNMKKKI